MLIINYTNTKSNFNYIRRSDVHYISRFVEALEFATAKIPIRHDQIITLKIEGLTTLELNGAMLTQGTPSVMTLDILRDSIKTGPIR